MCSMKRISTQILKYSQIEKKCVLNSTYISFIEHYQVCSASYVRYNDDERRKKCVKFWTCSSIKIENDIWHLLLSTSR